MRTELLFYENLGLTKVFVFYHIAGSPLNRWIHNDSMDITFGGMENITTWNKSGNLFFSIF